MTYNKAEFSLKFISLFLTVAFSGIFPLTLSGLAAQSDNSWQTEHLSPSEIQWLSNHSVIRIAPDPDFKPLEFFENDGTYSGIGADFLKLIESRLGIKFTIIRLNTWNEVISEFRSRKVDVLNAVVKTPEREKYMLFTSPYLNFPSVIISRKTVKTSLTMELLSGMKVVMVSGYGYADLMKSRFPQIDFDFSTDISAALRKVSLGLADAFVGDLATASQCIQDSGITNLKIVGETSPDNISGFGIRSDWPVLKEILEKACADITDIEKRTIISKWIQIEFQPGITLAEFHQTLSIIAGGIIVLLAWFLIWNRFLKRKIQESTTALEKELADRIRTQEQLARSKTMMRAMIDSLPMWLACTDCDGNYFIANKYYSDTFNIPMTQIQGHNFREFFPEPLYTNHKHLLDQCLLTNRPVTFEDEVLINETSGSRMVYGTYTPLIDDQGTCWGIGAAVSDITDLKNSEAEKLKLETQLTQSRNLDSIGRLAGGVAHDFNNMLGVILGYIEIIRDNIPLDSPILEDLKDMEDAAIRSRDLTGQLLTFSRKQVIVPDIINLNDIINLSIGTLSRLMGEDIQLVFNADANLRNVRMDSIQVDQILVNIAANARDAMPEGGKFTITTSNADIAGSEIPPEFELQDGSFALLSISDNGMGMTEDVKSTIFEPFFTTKEGSKGTGLGMATVYGIVRQNKGFILVDSSPGKGTAFHIYLPSSGTDRPQRPVHHRKTHGESPVCKANILLVEDEEMILRMTTSMLKKLGFQITATNSSLEAIEICSEPDKIFDLIISDVVMPEISGREMYERISMKNPGIPILYMSGYTSEIIARHGILEKGIHFIQKPFGVNELKFKIDEICSEEPKSIDGS
ncbi:MAG: hypothetical protein CVV64_14430 [Candidatus Wallbacteria bacterium HGW-Wallbacteria-1]|jgi:PAS domain S-box-containing protein|uniref:histidine kinase n=1 Tax=Candidatus Wallbacteria bacterium HGW-Wallbacteria-1 TaxID=2013854 RepID=A0A2N1PM53_9BACT|nr:MAG: hypothetical protein CVV64_14430 [Candidatus Wallbacteria bacterium HGW-Wallbacteria-1]